MNTLRLLLAFPTAIVVGILNVFLFFLFMVLYGYVINPGHEESFYQDAANRFGPYVSIIAGIPVMYIAGVILRRFLRSDGLKVGILAWFIYLVIDVSIVIAAGQIFNFLPHVVVSFVTKLVAIYLGAKPRTATV